MLIHFLTFCHYPLTNACTCFYLLLWATRWQCGLWNASAATTAWHSNFYCSFSNSLLTHVRICRSQCWAACNEAMFTERSITGGLVYIKQQPGRRNQGCTHRVPPKSRPDQMSRALFTRTESPGFIRTSLGEPCITAWAQREELAPPQLSGPTEISARRRRRREKSKSVFLVLCVYSVTNTNALTHSQPVDRMCGLHSRTASKCLQNMFWRFSFWLMCSCAEGACSHRSKTMCRLWERLRAVGLSLYTLYFK